MQPHPLAAFPAVADELDPHLGTDEVDRPETRDEGIRGLAHPERDLFGELERRFEGDLTRELRRRHAGLDVPRVAAGGESPESDSSLTQPLTHTLFGHGSKGPEGLDAEAGEQVGTMSFLYDVASSSGNTGRGLVVVKVVRDAVPDYPVVDDTVLTVETRDDFADGVDVLAGKTVWSGGDVGELEDPLDAFFDHSPALFCEEAWDAPPPRPPSPGWLGGGCDAAAAAAAAAAPRKRLRSWPEVVKWAQESGRPQFEHDAEVRAFVAQAHRQGLLVYMDVVYNHFGPEGKKLHLHNLG